MGIVEKKVNEMEMLEGKARMEKWVDEYIEKQDEKNKIIENIMSSTYYIEWLNHFTQDKNGFSDDDWLYSSDKLSDFDRKNVEMLNLFYLGIDKYARKNYIYPLLCDFGNFYKVKLNNFGFDVGMLVGQGTVFFFNKTAIENEDEFIDFNDVMVDKKQANVDQINATLDTLSNMVITFYESGVPIDAIVNTIDNTLKDITSKNVKKTRKLIK